ncbi:unnamed protein product, partial [Mesorhabditis spiculigera]
MRRRSRLDSEVDCTRNAGQNTKILIRERKELRRWKTSVEVRSPNLFIPPQIATHIENMPFAKLAVTKDGSRFVILCDSPKRQFEFYFLDGNTIECEFEIEIPKDDFASYCQLMFTETSLLVATRSSGFLDVFDQHGFHYYTIGLEVSQGNFDMRCAVCDIQSIAIDSAFGGGEDDFNETLYVLQYNGTFSIYKLGRMHPFKVCSVSLDIGLCGSFKVLNGGNLLLVSSHYRQTDQKPIAGLNVFRLIDGEPFVEGVKVTDNKSSWSSVLARFPFSMGNYNYLCSLAVNEKETHMCAVSTNGDVFMFELPSARLSFSIPFISGSCPRQVEFTDEKEICVLFSCGSLLRTSVDDLFEQMHSFKKEETREDDKYAPRTWMLAPRNRHLFALENEGFVHTVEEASKKRISMAFYRLMDSSWRYFKTLMGMAIGDSSTSLARVTHIEMMEFILSHTPTITLQELFERTLNERDYSRALSLASTYTTIDPDVVLKNQWKDACRQGVVTSELVEQILGQLFDVEFRAEACWASKGVDRDVQEALVAMGLEMADEAPLESYIRIVHVARLLHSIEDYELFLEMREKPFIEVAGNLAERAELPTLQKLVAANFDFLGPRLLSILERIPNCIEPREFAEFLPTWAGNDVKFETEPGEEAIILKKLAGDPNAEPFLDQVNTGCNGERFEKQSGSQDFTPWLRKRARLIDDDVGLPHLVVQLYELAIENGFTDSDIRSELTKWKQYQKYMDHCGLVMSSMDAFLKLDINALVLKYSKLSDHELSTIIGSVLEILEWKAASDGSHATGLLLSTVFPLLLCYADNGCETLLELHKLRPEFLDRESMIKYLQESQLKGDELVDVLEKLGFEDQILELFSTLNNYGLELKFSMVYEAFENHQSALGIFLKVANKGAAKCESSNDWRELRDDVLSLQQRHFPNTSTRKEALEAVVREFLVPEVNCTQPERLELFLTLSRGEPSQDVLAGKKFDLKQSIELLLQKCDECVQQATERTDPLLSQAKCLAQYVEKVSKDAADVLKQLQIIDLALDLGFKQIPVVIRYTGAQALLDDIVVIERNYKQGKKIAKLAVLLGIDTPVATALSMCALEALRRRDEEAVQKYLLEVMAKARGIEKVHQLCVQLIQTPFLKKIRDDIYACALLNAPVDELCTTMDLISEIQRQTSDEPRKTPPRSASSYLAMDPMYSMARRNPFSYSKLQTKYFNDIPDKEVKDEDLTDMCLRLGPPETVKVLAHCSASHSLGLAMALSAEAESTSWTTNDYLISYEEALRFHAEKLTPAVVEQVPPKVLIQRRIINDEKSGALDRLMIHGCDRERFIEDAVYRKESVVGIAMTSDEQAFNDAIELAENFRIDLYDVHFASLENAITSLPPAEASKLIKTRGHLPVLHQQLEKFQSEMRSTVLPLAEENDPFRLYLFAFPETAPERMSIPALKKLLEFADKCHFRLILKRAYNETSYLSQSLANFSDSQLNQLAPLLKLLPKGPQAVDSLVRFLIDGTELRPPASLLTLWKLLGESEEAFLDVVAIKSREDEIQFLASSPIDTFPAELQSVIKKRLEDLTGHEETPEPEEQSSSWDWGLSASKSEGLLNRRRH